MKNTFYNFIRTSVLSIGLIFSGTYYLLSRTDVLDGFRDVSLQTGNIRVPTYNNVKVKPDSCSMYARLLAEDLFGKKFSNKAKAWDRRYQDRLIAPISNTNVYENISQGILKPGMIIGVFNPKSAYKSRLDQNGHNVQYTHNVVYLGMGIKGSALFADQFHSKMRVLSLEQLTSTGFSVREIIDER